MFPLPNVFLFPGALMPLHVFEPRYRQMIEDSLDGPGRIVMAAVLESHHDQLAGDPPVFEYAGLGEIRHHERLPDGRFFINLVGCCRVHIREVPSSRLYRRVEATLLQETPATREEECALRSELAKAILKRTPKLRDLPLDMPIGHMADFLLMRLELPQSAMQEAFARLSTTDRARRALAEHERRPQRPHG
ncbi:MAG: LON peptidase substrate-binding domain-containing protein [Planctomycetes bacterium]|nr:LON peptidase substrate-binding domain-containing protein [Planctomycetota bacterium]